MIDGSTIGSIVGSDNGCLDGLIVGTADDSSDGLMDE